MNSKSKRVDKLMMRLHYSAIQWCEDLYLVKESRDFYPSSVSDWFGLMRNCIFQRKPKQALLIYARSHSAGIAVLCAIPLAVKACASLSMFCFGRALHAECVKSGVDFDVMIGTSLVDMYSKCRDVGSSQKMFDLMPERNVKTWNAMTGGYMRNGDTQSAMALFERMSMKTSVSWNQMIDGFAKRGDMAMAKRYFDRMPPELRTVVTWTIMVEGYACKGEMEAANEIFEVMPKKNFYVWSSMISGYFKKRQVEKAKTVFDSMTLRNLVNWNSLIAGYAQSGFCWEALDAFRRMQVEGFTPDEFTLVSVLSACAQLGFLEAGKEIHELIIQKRVPLNQFVLNGLLDMYAKCGDLSKARLIFETISHKRTASWNSLILGFAINGQCREAIDYFHAMESSGEKPDKITFLAVLTACAHGGFVKEGLETFSKMDLYDITASIKHYGCLVDVLGRAGRLEEAIDLIKVMPMGPNEEVLGALLAACRIHSRADMAELLLEEIEKLQSGCDSSDTRPYVLLSTIYAASEKWEKAEGMRVALASTDSQKKPGCSTVIAGPSKIFHSRNIPVGKVNSEPLMRT